MTASLHRLLCGLFLALPSVAVSQARTLDSAAVRLTAPSSRSVIVVEAANVSMLVTGHAGADVSAALVDTAGRRGTPSYEGILRMAVSHDTLRISFARPVRAWYELRVTVPEGVALRLAGDNGGPVRVSGIGGPAEITHSNGGVTVLNASGHVMIATSNGNLTAELTAVTPGVPMSFITDNGYVDLTFPASIKATLLVDDAITVESEFSLAHDGDRAPGPRRLLINGGGPTIRVFTNNGNLRVHRGAPSN